MNRSYQEAIDKRVLAVLRRINRGLTPSELVSILLSESELDTVDIKRAIWRLIYYQLAYMSPEQLISPMPERDDVTCRLDTLQASAEEKVA
jgi:hypothetical protein